MQSTASKLKNCRVCGNSSLIPCISIGAQYPSAVFPHSLDYRTEVPRLPLDLVLCEKSSDDSTCGLVQLAHQLDLTGMYEEYPYTSATNSSMPAILQDVAESGRRLGHLQTGDLILDIGCNDGTLLSFFKDQNFDQLGIDPARNVKPVLSSKDYTRINDFFSAEAYRSGTKKEARLIFSVAMFYHLTRPADFARDVAECLADDGVWIVQMAYLPTMIRTNMYDNIVHEHAAHYATHQMQWITERAGLEIFDVELNDVYGGSFRLFIKKKGSVRFQQTGRYRATLADELEFGIFDPATYRAFVERIGKTRNDLRELCRNIREEGKTIWIYGASTKGNTILQYCGVDKEDVVAAADSNPFKFGRYVVGADIPITDEPTMRAAKPDYLLALPYSFLRGFMQREAALLAGGTKFIVPLPEVHVVP